MYSICHLLNSLKLKNPELRGLSGKFADTANKTRIVYHRQLKLCINKYPLAGTLHTQYDWMFLNIYCLSLIKQSRVI